MNNSQLINQTSGKTEYYTPIEIVNAARAVMNGYISLDPASSAIANNSIKAHEYFTKEMDGLSRKWWGNVWMNHPFTREDNPLWVRKLVSEFLSGSVLEACCITYACTSEKWFQPLLNYTQCYLSPRTNYFLPDGTKKKGVPKGSVVTYLGQNIEAFHRNFKHMGSIMVPYKKRHG